MNRYRVVRLGRFSVRVMPSRLIILLALFLCLMLVALWSLTAGSQHIPPPPCGRLSPQPKPIPP
jgi:iron complex transport system permease protein